MIGRLVGSLFIALALVAVGMLGVFIMAILIALIDNGYWLTLLLIAFGVIWFVVFCGTGD